MVRRTHLPVFDGWHDHVPGTLTWLQAWYSMQCDGDWEHGHGVSIETLDNPGWRVRIDLAGTAARDRPLDPIESHRSEHDWLVVRLDGSTFEAACGPLNLGEALHTFRLWAEGPPAPVDDDEPP